MDNESRFWLSVVAIAASAIVACIIATVVGLYFAQINGTEQMRVCVESGGAFVDNDGIGQCIR